MTGSDQSTERKAVDGLVFVHVSDIHFHFKKNSGALDRDADIAHQLVLDAGSVTGRLGICHGIWVNGDIAYNGQQAEYDIAKTWLRQLCESVQCDDFAVWTVPGNHDVERPKPPAMRDTLIKDLRAGDYTAANDTLRGHLEGEDSQLLFRVLTQYNAFAIAFECSTAPNRPAWQDDLRLNDGSLLRLHGLTSTLCSNQHDDDKANKLVLGEFQLTGLREDHGVVHVVMCHHPITWLLDAKEVEPHLNARARIQLFGHEHQEVVTRIGDSLRIAAGAVSPPRTESRWEPRYSVLHIAVHGRSDQRQLIVRMYPRVWDGTARKFVEAAGGSPREYTLPLPRWSAPAPAVSSELPSTPSVHSSAAAVESAGSHRPARLTIPMRPERVLTYRFFELPYSVRLEVAVRLGLTADQDQGVTDPELTRRFFERARQKLVLPQLWEELRERLGLPQEPNPFKAQGTTGDINA